MVESEGRGPATSGAGRSISGIDLQMRQGLHFVILLKVDAGICGAIEHDDYL